MSLTYASREARLAKAIQEAQALENPVLGTIAKRYQVDRMTLVRRLEGSLSRSTRAPTNRKMTPEMEKGLVRYCSTLEDMGVAPTVEHLRKAALCMVGGASKDSDLDARLGGRWIERAIKRNNLFTVDQKSREFARVVACEAKGMKSYFMDFKKTRDTYGVLVC